jgi:hypothetical protein
VTYDELSRIRGIGRESAVKLAQRKRWRRVPGNDGEARVCVPPEWLTAAKEPTEGTSPEHSPQPSPDASRAIPALEAAISALTVRAERAEAAADRFTVELQQERARADRAEQRADNERARVEQAEEQVGELRRKLDASTTDLTAARARGDRLGSELDQARGKLAEAEAWIRRPWWRRLRRLRVRG